MKKVVIWATSVIFSILIFVVPAFAIEPFPQGAVSDQDKWNKICEFREKLPTLNDEQLKAIKPEIQKFFSGYVHDSNGLAYELVSEAQAKHGVPKAQISIALDCYYTVSGVQKIYGFNPSLLKKYDIKYKKTTDDDLFREACEWISKVLDNPKSTGQDKINALWWQGHMRVFISRCNNTTQNKIHYLKGAKISYTQMQQIARQQKDRDSYNKAAEEIAAVEERLKKISSDKMIKNL